MVLLSIKARTESEMSIKICTTKFNGGTDIFLGSACEVIFTLFDNGNLHVTVWIPLIKKHLFSYGDDAKDLFNSTFADFFPGKKA
jgi:hypothetical protein